jgi:hypothetical protein
VQCRISKGILHCAFYYICSFEKEQMGGGIYVGKFERDTVASFPIEKNV